MRVILLLVLLAVETGCRPLSVASGALKRRQQLVAAYYNKLSLVLQLIVYYGDTMYLREYFVTASRTNDRANRCMVRFAEGGCKDGKGKKKRLANK